MKNYGKILPLFILIFSILGSTFLFSCKKEICTTQTDCEGGQICVAGHCIEPEKHEREGIDAGEKIALPEKMKESLTEKAPSEPPAWPDIHWKEGRMNPPEHFVKPQFSSKQAMRKEGETCNPQMSALPEDRCRDGLLCVAPNLGSVGICRKRCSPDKSKTCTKNELCGPVPSFFNHKIVAYACGKAMNLGEKCTFGWYCKKGLRCVTNGRSFQGICLLDCQKGQRCPSGNVCRNMPSFPEKNSIKAACLPLAKEGEFCSPQRPCTSHTTCLTLKAHLNASLCLKSCQKNTQCPKGTTCQKISSHRNACVFQEGLTQGTRQLGESCHPYPLPDLKQLCQKGLTCAKLADEWRCVQKCTLNSPSSCQKIPHAVCTKLPLLDFPICIKQAALNEICAPNQSILCTPPNRCLKDAHSSTWHCRQSTPSDEEQSCLPSFKPCPLDRLCAGDPLTPFRWTCRPLCQHSSCPQGQICLKTNHSQACFPKCQKPHTPCPDQIHKCTSLQNHNVCL